MAAEKAAHEARRATNVAWIGAALSALAILGLIVTIIQGRGGLDLARRGNLLAMRENARTTRRSLAASEETFKALSIAQDNADSARQALSRDRAWLCSAGMEFGSAKDAQVGGKLVRNGFAFGSKYKNFGMTPATHVEFYSTHEVFPIGSALPVFKGPSIFPGEPGVIGPGDTFFGNPFCLDDEQTAAFRAGEVSVAIYCRAQYRDIFEPEATRTTESCLVASHGGFRLANGEKQEALDIAIRGTQNRVL